MPAIDPNWLPRVNGAIEGTWHLVLAHSIAHSSGGVWFERGVNREPMLGRQLQHVAIMMSTNVLCAVRVEDGQCIPAFDEIREALVERVIELGDDCPEVVRQLLHVAPEASKASDKTEADAIAEEIEALRTKKDARAFAELHDVAGLDDAMKLLDMKAVLIERIGAPEASKASDKTEADAIAEAAAS